MYDIVSSPNHVFVSCQHTRLSKLANVIDFKAHFPVVSIIFRLLVCFKSWQNRVKVYDRVLMDSDTIFVCFEAVWQQVFDGDFLTSKNEGKDLYVQRKKCHISGYFSHIENFSCEQCNEPDVDSLGCDGCFLSGPHEDYRNTSIFNIRSSKFLIWTSYWKLAKYESDIRLN